MATKPIPQKNNGRKELPVEFLRAILAYDPETGIFRWKQRHDTAFSNATIGKIAGSVDKDGYICIQINKRRFPAHRLAWAITTGKWPKNDIDHIKEPRTDNSWKNLREATRQQNLRNMKMRATNTSGFKWVRWHKSAKAWVAQIRDGKTNRYLGCYKTPEEAHEAACRVAERLHKEFARFK